MTHFEQEVKPDRALELSMKWEGAFQDLMDDIYHPGYATKLLLENPKGYQTEYYYFISLYDGA